MSLTAADILPEDHTPDGNALLVGRVYDPDVAGPCLVVVGDGRLHDITDLGPTMSDLLGRDDLVEVVRAARESASDTATSWSLDELLAAGASSETGAGSEAGAGAGPRVLAPIDLQVIKAAGVTFAKSMLERVIEEQAKGDPQLARGIREKLLASLGSKLTDIRAGSPDAQAVKKVLVDEGLWSQYLEVGIGPDPEIFTKAPVLAAVGVGAQVGVLERSVWNNPEPEVVLVVTGDGRVVGATLGNDVNLRDFEGRSALLLAEAKDNNASCAIGPFVRLFDETFSMDDVRRLTVTMQITGADDGFDLSATSSLTEMSRDPDELVRHAYGRHHQYPDGFVLFTGTMFAPTEDRDAEGEGFTHHTGDVVRISTPQLGALVNTVGPSEKAPEWTFGIGAFMRNLADRGLLG